MVKLRLLHADHAGGNTSCGIQTVEEELEGKGKGIHGWRARLAGMRLILFDALGHS